MHRRAGAIVHQSAQPEGHPWDGPPGFDDQVLIGVTVHRAKTVLREAWLSAEFESLRGYFPLTEISGPCDLIPVDTLDWR